MNQPWVIALIAAIPPTLVALAALIASIRNGKKTDAVDVRLDGALDEWRREIRELATIKEKARADAEQTRRDQ
jgi:hypothetical protein